MLVPEQCAGAVARAVLVGLDQHLDLVPEVFRDDRFMESRISRSGMSDLAEVGPVLEYAVQGAPGEASATPLPSVLVDASLAADLALVEVRLEAQCAAQLQVAPIDLPDLLGLLGIDHQRLVLDVVAQGRIAPGPHPLLLGRGDLVSDSLPGDLPLELGEGQQHVQGDRNSDGTGQASSFGCRAQSSGEGSKG